MSRTICLLLISALTIVNAIPIQNRAILEQLDTVSDLDTKFIPENDIRYLLYTRKNPSEYQIIKKGDVDSLFKSNFNGSNPVKITIHGWDTDYTSTTNTLIRDAFLSISDVNHIAVDWGVGALVGYLSAVRNTLQAGPSVAEFLDWMNELGVSFTDMHVIGHSLGGQMAGLVGRNVRGTLQHITALDPAHPSWGPNSERIRKTDAKYVEIIHTNIGILGMTDAVGHNDFYPNKGRDMPGCDGDFNCSHSRSRDYFAESILSGGFTAVQCQTVSEATSGLEQCTGNEILQMGGSGMKPELGIFALNTNAAPPYSKN